MSVWIAPAAVLAVFWLWFLARGKAPGGAKRLAFRATLLAVLVGLLVLASSRGLLSRASPGFQLVLLLALLAVELGYLYTTRFCLRCGLMVRNLKLAECPRCKTLLPRHGMTSQLRRPQRDVREEDRRFRN